MDTTLSKIVRDSGFNFRFQYNDGTQNFDHIIYKFAVDNDVPLSTRKVVTETVIRNLLADRFIFDGVGFEKLQRGKGPDYWALAIRVPVPFPDRAIDRDVHGNLIFIRPRRRRIQGTGS